MDDKRRQILDAALAIADEDGLDAVSMRSVAARVGVSPMALYPYVGSKAALLDGLVGRLLGELSTGDAPGDWREGLRLASVRSPSLQSPGASPVDSSPSSRPTSPSSKAAFDPTYG